MSIPTLLYVDDSEEYRTHFQELISEHMPHARLHIASKPEQGLALAQRLTPDCAILDLHMPGMSGIELCRRLKADKETAHFPILLITGHNVSAEMRVNGLEAGADAFLQRPCADIDLLAQIGVLLRIRRAEEELRSVNRQLAELAGLRSRALHESDERYRLLLENCSDAVLVFELKEDVGTGRFVEVNDNACRWLGYSQPQLLDLTLKDLFPPDRFLGVQGRIESILTHKQVYFETVVLARDGRPITVGVTARVFDLGDRRTIIAIIRDLEHGDQAGETESEVDTRYRTLAARTGQMIYDCDLQAGRMKLGGAMTQVTGYTPDELAGLTLEMWTRMIHPDDRNRVTHYLQEALQAVGPYQVRYCLQHKSGEYRHIEDVGVALPDEEGRAYRVLGTLKDITARIEEEEEQRRLEQEMQHSQKLESLGVLAGGIAHDFNNILAAIIGLTDMAVQDLPEDSEVRVDMQEALQAAHRAKDLVKQILMFSRQSGEERAPLLLHVVVREALKLLRASLPATIEIIDVVDVHSGAVMANAAQMHQIVMNYCTNAAQAMPDRRGRIEVRLTDVTVDERFALSHPKLQPGPYLKLSVADTGHGMAPQVVTRIFDPFYTTKGPGEGTGMGLAVVHGIVSSHGGAVLVESKSGAGSTFHTYLPRITDTVEENAAPDESLPGGDERILFVDDEESVVHFGESFLPRLGYHAVFCQNAREAIKTFEQDPGAFDLVITDQVMPKMTGLELAEILHAARPELPIILFTGFSEHVTERQARKVGVRELVLKPVIPIQLAKVIRRALDE